MSLLLLDLMQKNVACILNWDLNSSSHKATECKMYFSFFPALMLFFILLCFTQDDLIKQSIFLTQQQHVIDSVSYLKKQPTSCLHIPGGCSSSIAPEVEFCFLLSSGSSYWTDCVSQRTQSHREGAECIGQMCFITLFGSFLRGCWPVWFTYKGKGGGIQKRVACGSRERRRWWREPTQVSAYLFMHCRVAVAGSWQLSFSVCLFFYQQYCC